jgi:hypothetical protein
MRSNHSVPDHPVHPDREELAAWQADALTEPARARIGSHLAGCAECSAVVAAVERGRAALASLEEPELPEGLHERIAAAIAREPLPTGRERVPLTPVPAAASPDGPAARPPRRRRPAWRRPAVALSAAAAVVLLVAGLVPVLLHQGGGGRATSSGAPASGSGGGSGSALAPNSAPSGAPGALPVFQAAGEYSGSALRTAVSRDPAIRAAYARAGAVRLAAGGGGRSTAAGGQPETQPDSNSGSQKAAPGAVQQACVEQVLARSSEALRPAFLVETVYRGRPATVLVTRSPGSPDQAELWAFPRGDCSKPPFAIEQRIQVPPP